MAKKAKKAVPTHPPLERNPVILSLILLKEMGIEEAQHSKFGPLWAPLWAALVAYRDSKPLEAWTTWIMEGILSGQATFDSGSEWVRLNEVLNEIWEAANAG